MNIGGSNRLKYDKCNYQKEINESTWPLMYQLYQGKFENCNKCIFNKVYFPYDLVDIESELRNQTRPNSHCDQFKYNPNCKKSNMCISTYDNSVPKVAVPEICPIIYNNIQKSKTIGYRLPNPNFC